MSSYLVFKTSNTGVSQSKHSEAPLTIMYVEKLVEKEFYHVHDRVDRVRCLSFTPPPPSVVSFPTLLSYRRGGMDEPRHAVESNLYNYPFMFL